MGRNQWLAPFAWNFEPEKRAPIDARFVVEYQSDLVQLATWTAYDWNERTYKGMFVSVWNDNTNNWIYILIADDYTQLTNWVNVGDTWTTVLEDNRVSKYQVTTPFQANEVIDLTNWTGSIAWVLNHFWDIIDWTDKDIWAGAWVFFSDNALNVYLKWTGELYKSDTVVWDSPTSFHFTVPLQIWDYFWVERDAWMGMWGTTWADALEWTYAELEVLKDTNSLVPWNWYKLTDYLSKNSTSNFWMIYTSTETEPLYLQATSTNTFAQNVYSELHFDDNIKYNFNDNLIFSYTNWGWDDWSWDWGDDTTISNITPTSFEINKEYDWGSFYYLYIEDSSNSYEYDENWYWTNFTATDLWGWQRRIDILDAPLDLTDWGGYIEIEWYKIIEERPWYIIYRKDNDKNIEASFDFRHHWTTRAKIDVSWYSAWNSATNYSYRDVVLYNWALFIAMWDTTNETPHLWNSRVWFPAILDYDKSYCSWYYWLYIMWVSIPVDLATSKIFDTFWIYDTATETTTHDLSLFKDVSILSEDILINPTAWQKIEWLIVESKCVRNTFLWGVEWFILKQKSQDIILNLSSQLVLNTSLWYLDGYVFSNYISQNTFFSGRQVFLNNTRYCNIYPWANIFVLSNWYSSQFWEYASTFRVGYAYKSNFWAWCINSYIRATKEDNIDSCSRVYSYTDDFQYNIFGKIMHNLTITSWQWFEKNIFWNEFWGLSTGNHRTINFPFRRNNWGTRCFYTGTTSAPSGFYDNIMGNSCRDISASRFRLNILWNNVSDIIDISWEIKNVRFDSNVRQIRSAEMAYCEFKFACVNIDISWWQLDRAIFDERITSLDLSSATIFYTLGNASKRIIIRPDSTVRLQYTDNTDTLQIVDPTL